MSARILSMGFTAWRITGAGHEIACCYFLTHEMYIGNSILRFRSFSYLYPAGIRYA